MGISQLASRVPENEKVKALRKTFDALVKINVDLRRRLERLKVQGVQPAPTMEEGRKRLRPHSSSEETNERDVYATRKRVARIESSSSSPEERMEMDEMDLKPQRTISERPEAR